MSDSSPVPLRSIDLLSHQECQLVVVDVQEKLLPVIPEADNMTHRIRQLLQAAAFVQNPAALFRTISQRTGADHARVWQNYCRLPGRETAIQCC